MTIRRTLPALAAAGLLLLAPGAAVAELAVVVTSKPIHALVSSVMRGVGAPALLVDGPASPHSYALKPSDARKVHGADVFFRVSEELEPFTGKLVRSLPPSVRVVSLVETPGLKLLPRRRGGAFEAHGEPGAGADSHDDEDEHGDHAHDHDGVYDPHVWLDPANANAMVQHIADVLARLAPDTAMTIKANAEAESGRLDALADELARDLAPLSGKTFMVYHDAHQYFERRYGLAVVGAVTVSPDLPPSGKRLQELREKLQSAGVLCVFAEPYSDPRVTNALIEGTGARSGALDPEGTTLAAGPDLYVRLMRELARSLKVCLTSE